MDLADDVHRASASAGDRQASSGSSTDSGSGHNHGSPRRAGGTFGKERIGVPAVVCLPVPSEDAGDDMRVLKSDDGGVWTYLDPVDPPSAYDPGSGNVAVCGMTDRFLAVRAGGGGDRSRAASGRAGLAGLIARIEPSIRDVTVSQGDARYRSELRHLRPSGTFLNNELGERS